jgi:hypothetical protein
VAARFNLTENLLPAVQPVSYLSKHHYNMHFLTTIGITLATIGAILIFILKRPLKTSDKLLIAILVTFVVKFGFDEVFLITANYLYSAIAAIFGISTIITCGWYIKYLTDTETGFGVKQLYVYLPLAIISIPMLVLLPYAAPGIGYYIAVSVVTLLILYYFWFCIEMLRKHQRLIRENYSGAPGSITVNWMIIIIALQIVEFFVKGVLQRVITSDNNIDVNIITNEYCFIIMTFLLVVLGIWQKSIPVFIPANEEASQSVLQADDLKRYQLKIEKFMDDHRPYLDPELTMADLKKYLYTYGCLFFAGAIST